MHIYLSFCLLRFYSPPKGTRFDDGGGTDNEVQRTMLEIVNQLDGFDERGKIRVIMATNRPDTLDPALTRPGRLDRQVEVGLPDLDGRANIFRIHTKTMAGESRGCPCCRFLLLSIVICFSPPFYCIPW